MHRGNWEGERSGDEISTLVLIRDKHKVMRQISTINLAQRVDLLSTRIYDSFPSNRKMISLKKKRKRKKKEGSDLSKR